MQKPDNFSGSNSENVKHWLRGVDLFATVHGLSDHRKICLACSALIGKAAIWLDEQCFETWLTWSDFAAACTERFSERCCDSLLDTLMTTCQLPGESARDYLQKVLSANASLEDLGEQVPDALLLLLYVKGLSSAVRHKVKIRRPKTLHDAAEDAEYFAGLCEEEVTQGHRFPQEAQRGGRARVDCHQGTWRRQSRPMKPFSPRYDQPCPNFDEQCQYLSTAIGNLYSAIVGQPHVKYVQFGERHTSNPVNHVSPEEEMEVDDSIQDNYEPVDWYDEDPYPDFESSSPGDMQCLPFIPEQVDRETASPYGYAADYSNDSEFAAFAKEAKPTEVMTGSESGPLKQQPDEETSVRDQCPSESSLLPNPGPDLFDDVDENN